MWEDMANKPFFQFLKLRGRLPEGMGDDSDKGDSMAANAALERMAETTDRLTDKVIDLATEASRRPEGNQDQVQGMKLMHEAGRESISFMRETMSEITKNQNSNPLEVVEKVVSLVGVMNGGNSKTDVILEMMKSEREIAARREESIREELRDARKRSDDLMMLLIKKENADEEPKGLMGRLMEKVMSDAIDGIGKKTDDAAEPSGGKSNMRDTIMTMLIPVLPSIMGTVDNIVKNVMTGIMVGKAGTVTPGASPMAPVAQPTLTTAPPPPAAPANPLTPFLTAITGSFLHHFNQGPEFGCVFADWLKNSGPITTWPQPGMTGQGVYDFMKEQEAQTPGAIKAVLQTHPPIWSNVEGVPAKLDGFIAEFLKDEGEEPEAAE
jgi:hypothetical protein